MRRDRTTAGPGAHGARIAPLRPRYARHVKTITEHEFVARTEAVLDDVAAGAFYRVTRNGRAIAEVRPVAPRRRFAPVDELRRKWLNAPGPDSARMRAEADTFFGDEDRLDDGGPGRPPPQAAPNVRP